MYARFIPNVAFIWIFYFLRLNNVCSIVCICYLSFILSSINVLLCCFHILAIVNNTSMNTDVQICVQILLWDCAFNPFEYLPRMEFLDLMLILFLFLFIFILRNGHSDSTTLCSLPYYSRDPISIYPCQHLLFLCFWY